MANKIIIGLLVVALAANSVLGYFAFMQKGDINALVEQLAAARQEATASATAQAEELDTARQEITSLIGENTDLIADLAEDIASNLAGITTESGRINALGNNLSALSGNVDDIVPGLAADEIYQQVSQTVVEISDGEDTVGAGLIYHLPGYVVTAYHVIEDLDSIYVIFYDGTISRASLVGSAIHSDVAVLELENPTTLTPATMADSNTLSIGDHALVVGHPFDEDNSLTVGVVSQLNRFEGIGYEDGERWIANLIQFDAPANFGNSGGPVFNADGDIIGMVIARVNPLIGEGMSYAIPSNELYRVAFDIITRGVCYFLYLGVSVTDITPVEAEAEGYETVHGALVTDLSSWGPAAQAGIQVGDIIVAIDDGTGNVPIDNVGDLASYLGGYYKGGGKLYITVNRNGTELTFESYRDYHTSEEWSPPEL